MAILPKTRLHNGEVDDDACVSFPTQRALPSYGDFRSVGVSPTPF
jgi:hypothetical protein